MSDKKHTNNNQGPRIDFKARRIKMLDDFYVIAETMSAKARGLIETGEDIRSNAQREGASTLLHAAQKAIDEIVRLTPLCDIADADQAENNLGVNFNLPKYDDSLRLN